MMQLLQRVLDASGGLLTPERVMSALSAVILLVFGWVLARAASAIVTRIAVPRTSAQGTMIARRVAFYLVFGIAAASALSELGFDLSVFLGAAGILTVAVGFASQTSASNLISGLFLLGERPFVVGDAIQVGTTTGEVVSIDLLSVKLRTYDNLLVRLPNESLLKSEIRNLTYFPIRRFDLRVGVPYDCDLAKAREALLAAAVGDVRCLDEPSPLVLFAEFADSAMVLELRAWSSTPNFLAFRNALPDRVKVALDAAGISIPFPQRTLTFGPGPAPWTGATHAGAEADES